MEKNKISFKLRSDIVVKIGLLKTFITEIEVLNLKKPLIIWDRNLENSEYFRIIKPELEKFYYGWFKRALEV